MRIEYNIGLICFFCFFVVVMQPLLKAYCLHRTAFNRRMRQTSGTRSMQSSRAEAAPVDRAAIPPDHRAPRRLWVRATSDTTRCPAPRLVFRDSSTRAAKAIKCRPMRSGSTNNSNLNNNKSVRRQIVSRPARNPRSSAVRCRSNCTWSILFLICGGEDTA